jgi:hypothetical protein
MKIVIDVTAAQFLLVLNSQHHAHHYAEGDASVSRTYSALTLEQLRRLYHNTTGRAINCPDYNATLQACKYLANLLLTAIHEGRQDVSTEEETG